MLLGVTNPLEESVTAKIASTFPVTLQLTLLAILLIQWLSLPSGSISPTGGLAWA